MKNSKRNYYPFWKNNGAKKGIMPEGKNTAFHAQKSLGRFEVASRTCKK